MKEIFLIFVIATLHTPIKSGILYPRSSPIREQLSLDGLWKFSLLNSPVGPNQIPWGPEKLEDGDDDLEIMPVPASYNDISTNAKVRDHVGVVQYQRNFFVPNSWQNKLVWLRFGSVCYAARVFVNNKLVVTHSIGHLPFLAEVTDALKFGETNDIRVLVDNTLTITTIPQGSLEQLPSKRIKQDYTFDFFNYAGIDRPVVLYTTEQTYIDDITLNTRVEGTSGFVDYEVSIKGTSFTSYRVIIVDKEGNDLVMITNGELKGTFQITNANLWWPYLMSDNPGYLYTFRVDILGTSGNILDQYEQPFGIRQLTWDNSSFKINGKPIYLRGFGRHEDSDIRGKGLDLPLIIRDHNLIKWIGANSYRTSHYPYAEEIMDLADSLGIMIIDEVPAVNIDDFNDALLENHKQSLTELVQRDKNRPSVIMWSVSNEPRTQHGPSEPYFRDVIAHLKTLDTSRPATLVNYMLADVDHCSQLLDIISFNRYDGWYHNDGDLDIIVPNLLDEVQAFHDKHNKPVLLSEYGADTLEGLHFLPTYIWSEEFQTDLMSRHFDAFDQLRAKGWFIGEMIWNFADFKTAQTYTRVGGNKKGIFTRQRQPKSSAHLLRKRYWALAELLDNATLPIDLETYVIQKKAPVRDEF